MSKFVCQKTYKVEYAHQLFTSYSNLCHETIHGHSGKIEIQFENLDGELNSDSMVMDFGEINALIKDHIMFKYDHALFMPRNFPGEYLNILKNYNNRLTITDENPTAENFAKWIYEEVNYIFKNHNLNIRAKRVTFWETETGCAIYE